MVAVGDKKQLGCEWFVAQITLRKEFAGTSLGVFQLPALPSRSWMQLNRAARRRNRIWLTLLALVFS